MTGIHTIEIITRATTAILPTEIISNSVGFFLICVQISIVKIVDEELKIEVREDSSAAIITAIIKPDSPKAK